MGEAVVVRRPSGEGGVERESGLHVAGRRVHLVRADHVLDAAVALLRADAHRVAAKIGSASRIWKKRKTPNRFRLTSYPSPTSGPQGAAGWPRWGC